MKKILYSVFALAMAAFTFTSCEDVPAPYDDPNGTAELPIVIEPAGDGTAASPYNVARILEVASTLEDKEDLPNKVYITGVVVGIEENYDGGFGNATFSIADHEDSNTTFLVYRAKYLNNQNWQEGQDILEFGDSVVVYGTVTNYGGTIETDQNNAYLVYLNGQTGEGGGGDDKPVLPEGTYIDETFYDDFGVFTESTIKGTPWIIDYNTAKATGYDNASGTTTPSESYLVSTPIDLSASEGATISFEYILRYVTNYGEPKDGVNNKVLVTDNYTGDPTTTTWTDITGTLTEGRDWETWETYTAAIPAELIGKSNVTVALYYSCEDESGTWEVKNLKVVEGDGESGEEPGGDDQPGTSGEGLATVTKSGNVVTMVDPDATESSSTATYDLNQFTQDEMVEATTVTMDDGTVITWSQEGGHNAPMFHSGTRGVRMYALNSMTITPVRKIARIVLECDSYNGTDYIGNPQMYTEINGNEWKTVNDWSSNSGGTQLRIRTLTVTFAE